MRPESELESEAALQNRAALLGEQDAGDDTRDVELADWSEDDDGAAEPAWRRQMCEETQLFWEQKGVLAAALFVLVYFALVLFRNLAYYRYVAAPRLRDIGYDAMPEFGPRMMLYADLPIHTMYAVVAFVLLGAALGPHGTRWVRSRLCCAWRGPGRVGPSTHQQAKTEHPHFVNVMRRFMTVYAIGHVMRGLTYLSTSIPGTAEHCLPGAKLQPPQTLLECFYRVSSVNGNCGDLIFSGHMLFMYLAVGLVHRYGALAWGALPMGSLHVGLMLCCGLLAAVQVVFIIKSRHHYTVDIVVATYTVPMLWFWYNTVCPRDLAVDQGAIDGELRKDKCRPYWLRLILVVRTCVCMVGLLFMALVVVHGNFHYFGF